MITFFITLGVFLLVLFYLLLMLSLILKWRSKVEKKEFDLRRCLLILCSFSEKLDYLKISNLEDERLSVLGARSIRMMDFRAKNLTKILSENEHLMKKEDKKEWINLKRNVEDSSLNYENGIKKFNKRIKNPFVLPLSKALKVHPLKESRE